MSFLVAIAIYVIRVLRRPMDVRLKLRHAGPLAVVSGAGAVVAAWSKLRPDGIATSYLLGEVLGVLAVYLMTWTTVLATRLPTLERCFGGLDRMYFWHRLCGIWSLLLFIPHTLVTSGSDQAAPAEELTFSGEAGRALGLFAALGLIALTLVSLGRVSRLLRVGYRLWLVTHRFIGLMLVAALVHGWLLDEVLAGSAVLRVGYVIISAVGVTAYGYDELLLRRRAAKADYVIKEVLRPGAHITDVLLTPTGAGSPLRGGQFVYLSVGGEHRWRAHPFSVAGTSSDGSVRLTIRSRGRDTLRMHENLRPGLPAVVNGPYGMFDHTLGGARQIWIAGGIGVAPFLGWLTTERVDEPSRIDLFYCTGTEAEAVFLPDLVAAADRLPNLEVHPVFSEKHGRLTVDRVQAAAGPVTADTHVFLCGPAAMVARLGTGLRQKGIPRDYVHAEHFEFR
ncbi:ferric reductase-like transmembrane domain-containing protein [Amycolatopsis sp. NPDC051106]|uniref:ferredoxin reductase family protein n=1 Tax=unclassified Amycolatopsis TaxID=2618356 RepID=UPI0034424394